MSPILLTSDAYSELESLSLPPIIKQSLSSQACDSPMRLLEKSGGAELAHVVGESYQRELLELLEMFPSPDAKMRFAVDHYRELSALLISNGCSFNEDVKRAAVIYGFYEAALSSEPMSWGWRNNSHFTKISCTEHGDTIVLQTAVSNNTEPDKLYIEAEYNGFCLSQDTSPLLISILFYARSVNSLNLPIIQNYKEEISRVRRNPWGNPETSRKQYELSLENRIALECTLAGESFSSEHNYYTFNTTNNFYLPRISKSNLEFLRRDDRADIIVPGLPNIKFSREMIFSPHDIPDLFTAIYKVFARSPTAMNDLIAAVLANA